MNLSVGSVPVRSGLVGPETADLQVVCFDFWNTIMHEARPRALVDARLPVIRRKLETAGYDISLEALGAAHDEAQRRFEDAWARNIQFRSKDAAEVVARSLKLAESTVSLIDEGFASGSAAADVRLIDDARLAIETARRIGAKTAIVSDIGLSPSHVLCAWLEEHDLVRLFDLLVFSDEIGIYKPSPAIFARVFEELGGVEPQNAVHIGDRRSTDVAGAQAARMWSIRFSQVYDDQSELQDADFVVGSMKEVAQLLSRPWPPRGPRLSPAPALYPED